MLTIILKPPTSVYINFTIYSCDLPKIVEIDKKEKEEIKVDKKEKEEIKIDEGNLKFRIRHEYELSLESLTSMQRDLWGIKHFAKILKNSTAVKELLFDEYVKEHDMLYQINLITDALRVNTSVSVLCLSSCNLSTSQTEKIIAALQNNTNLKDLNLSYNRVTKSIIELINNSNIKIEILNLSGCFPNTYNDLAAIINSLTGHKSIIELNLSCNMITDEAAKALTKMLMKSNESGASSLSKLKISWWAYVDKSLVPELIEALPYSNIQEIDIHDLEKISKEASDKLPFILAANKQRIAEQQIDAKNIIVETEANNIESELDNVEVAGNI